MSSVTIPINNTSAAGNLTIQGSGSYTLNNTWSNSPSTAYTDIQSKLKVQGDAEFSGDVRIKGRSLDETLGKIEERLGILVPNKELEEGWAELHQLRMQYVELERKLLEKQRTFDILKKQ